ncbi:CoA-binding protein [Demequina lutea]|uniref:Putative CoA-binding protein n=1 Tax=Demequina lutea TaxID=431489 RepID=A0A7Y9ZAR3_9MICO|nr:CoA-binding protein [Demequina lutea]NYI41934.1 putative CoA-binding protein [Demequina lutea]
MTTPDAPAESCPMPRVSQAPTDDVLALILARSHAVAVVGASPHPDRTSHAVCTWLMNHTPFELYLVNPNAGDADIEGHGFYASLADVPAAPDIVVVFRRSEDVPPVAVDAVKTDAAVLWMQLGIESEIAAATARAAGMDVIENRCIKVEYARLRDQIVANTIA